MKKIIYLGIILIIAIFAFVGLFLINNKQVLNKKTKAADYLVNLSLISPEQTIDSITEFAIPITINTNNNMVTALELHIKYDAENFDFVRIDPSSFFTNPIVLSPAQSKDGVISYIIAHKVSQSSKGVSGSGFLATVVFKPKRLSPGTFLILLTKETKVSALEKEGTVLGEMKDAKVIITSSSTSESFFPTITPVDNTSTSTESSGISTQPIEILAPMQGEGL